MSDLDRYYTPADVARKIVQSVEAIGDSALCVDPTCGSGNLLDACEAHFNATRCIGLDRDAMAIRTLRKRRPHWTLSTADLLNRRSFPSSSARRHSAMVDLIVLNPPFSQVSTKFIEISYDNNIMRVSHAMACVLRSLELFRPRSGAVAILPESALFSELDESARRVLSHAYVIDEIFGLKSTTFRGARARTVAVRLTNSVRFGESTELGLQAAGTALNLVRGSLPVHVADFWRGEVPYVHTTDIKILVKQGVKDLRRAQAVSSGMVRGWQVLFDRVGLPRREYIRPIFLRSHVALSDCVIAIGSPNLDEVKLVISCVQERWDEFLQIYRGTGARYVTVNRLRAWFAGHGITLGQ